MNEIWVKIQSLSFKEIHLKMLSEKCGLCSYGLDVIASIPVLLNANYTPFTAIVFIMD